MTTDFLAQLGPLLAYRHMPATSTPLVNRLDRPGQPLCYRLFGNLPIFPVRLAPIMGEAQQVKRLWLTKAIALTTGMERMSKIDQP